MNNIPCTYCEWDPTLKVTARWAAVLNTPAVSQNQLKGNGRGRSGWVYRKVRDHFFELLKANSRAIPKATECRRVFFTREYSKRCRPYDRDNLVAGFKPVRDALTMLGLIKDDNAQWLQAHYTQQPGDKNRVLIVIETVVWNDR